MGLIASGRGYSFFLLIICLASSYTSGFVIVYNEPNPRLENDNVGQSGNNRNTTSATTLNLPSENSMVKSPSNTGPSRDPGTYYTVPDTKTTTTTTENHYDFTKWLYKYNEQEADREQERNRLLEERPGSGNGPSRFPWAILIIIGTAVGVIALIYFQDFCSLITNERSWRRNLERSAHRRRVAEVNGGGVRRPQPEQVPQAFAELFVLPRSELRSPVVARSNPVQLIAPIGIGIPQPQFSQPNLDPPPPYPDRELNHSTEISAPPPGYSEVFP